MTTEKIGDLENEMGFILSDIEMHEDDIKALKIRRDETQKELEAACLEDIRSETFLENNRPGAH